MTGAISHIALYAPIAASSGIFAFRRAEKGIDNMDENPLFGTANLFIAGGQTLKGIQNARLLLAESETVNNTTAAIQKLGDSTKKVITSNKVLNGFGKTFKFISNNVNDMICIASIIKILGSDDKADAAVRESLGLGAMFACEAGAKRILGLTYKKRINGITTEIPPGHSMVRNLFNEGQTKAMKDFAASSKFLTKISKSPIPSVAKGILFVLASIGGYKLGSKLADWALGKSETKPTKKHNK